MTDIEGTDIMAKVVKLLTNDSPEFMRQVAPSFLYQNTIDEDFIYLDAAWQVETLYHGVHTVIHPLDSLLIWGAGDAIEVTDSTYPLLVEAYVEILPSYLAARIADDQMWKRHHVQCAEAAQDYRWAHNDNMEGYEAPKAGRVTAPLYARDVANLFACKVMRMRPQGAAYSYIPEDLWDLFDEAGPERAVGFGNPSAPGEYRKTTAA